MRKLFYCLLLIIGSTTALASAEIPLTISGKDINSGKSLNLQLNGKKGLVLVFLSAVCPCSDSHIKELKSLSTTYPEFLYVGVHANTNEPKSLTQDYFKKMGLPFLVIRDTGAKLADQYKALKTPHVFVVKADGTTAYQGGVSSSRNFDEADGKYLRDALGDIHEGREIKRPLGRTLGCAIDRGGEYVW